MHLLVTGGAGFIGSNVIHRIIDEPVIERLVNLDCLTYAGHLENVERVAANPTVKKWGSILVLKPGIHAYGPSSVCCVQKVRKNPPDAELLL